MGHLPQELEPLTARRAGNYSSAALFEDDVERAFLEERGLGMVPAPFSKEETAKVCGCSPENSAWGPWRAFRNRTKSGPSSMPTTPASTSTRSSPRPLFMICCGRGANFTLFKSEVSKPHRRIKVRPQDWKCMIVGVVLPPSEDFLRHGVRGRFHARLGSKFSFSSLVRWQGTAWAPSEKLEKLRPMLTNLQSDGGKGATKSLQSWLWRGSSVQPLLQWIGSLIP